MSKEDTTIYQQSPFSSKAFEGASTDYKNGLRGLQTGEADMLIARELRYLQLRSRYAVNNNGYARQALNTRLTKLGAIEHQWKTPTKDGSYTTHQFMTDVWHEFSEGTDENSCNIDNIGDYKTAQALSNSSIFLDGVSFQQLVIQRTNNSNVVPLKIKQIPAMLHAMEVRTNAPVVADTTILYGIRFSKQGVPLSYFFNRSYLENSLNTKDFNPAVHVEIPASEIIHTFHRDYAGQWLGVPILSPVLIALYELDDFIGATVQKQKAAQAIALVISQTNQALATTSKPGIGVATSVTDTETGQEEVVFKTTGTNTLNLNPGEQAALLQSGDIGANWNVLVRTVLQEISVVCDILYHELTNDTGNMSFSAIIALLLQNRNRLEYLHLFETIPLREKPLAMRFRKYAALYDKAKTPSKHANAAKPFFKLPKWRSLDELKDTQADVLALQNNLGLWQDYLSERGISIEEWKEDKELQRSFKAEYGVDFSAVGNTANMNQASNNEANSNSTGV